MDRGQPHRLLPVGLGVGFLVYWLAHRNVDLSHEWALDRTAGVVLTDA
ncbi:hypothetical protein RCO28_36510 [Streptomyces sp. LHD-70]|nr:hypothetical protein [Streptomyces sp. LHD-70]MDQ8707930.1 hypothetical protein [Streptomyces sp. LHD-70]